MPERRYSDDEISIIFSKAVEGHQPSALDAPHQDGLTLGELQEIGREVGIAPSDIARAARSLAVSPQGASRRLLGLPIGVERSVELGRWLTDDEWEQLVVRLREVFDARGTVSAHGNLRQWTNGNLQALLEPTPTGHRLRLRTTKDSARVGIPAGLAAFGMGGIVAIVSAIGGHLAAATPGVATMALLGLGMMAYAALPLPAWARLRGQQMDAITSQLTRKDDENDR